MSMKRLTNRDFTQDRRDPQSFTSNERILIPAGSKRMIIKHPYVNTFNSLGKKVLSYMFISCRDIIPQVITIDNIYSPGTWDSEVIAECKDHEEFVTVRITHISESGVTTPISWEFSYSFLSSSGPRFMAYRLPSSSSKTIMKKLTNKDFSPCGDYSLLSNSMIRVPKGARSVAITDLDMKVINVASPELCPSIHIQMRIGNDVIGTFSFHLGNSGIPNVTSGTIESESMEIKDGRMELTISVSPKEDSKVVGDWEFSYGFMGLLDTSREEKVTDEDLTSEVTIQSSSTEEKMKPTMTLPISRKTFSLSVFLLGSIGALVSATKRSSTGLIVSGSIMYISSTIFLHEETMRRREEHVRRVACRCDE